MLYLFFLQPNIPTKPLAFLPAATAHVLTWCACVLGFMQGSKGGLDGWDDARNNGAEALERLQVCWRAYLLGRGRSNRCLKCNAVWPTVVRARRSLGGDSCSACALVRLELAAVP